MELDRRRFLLGGAVATATVWAAPSITTLDAALGAQGSPKPCNAEAYDFLIRATGPVTAVAGPFRSCPTGTSGSAGAGSVTLPGTTGAILTARAFTATCGGDPCCGRAEIAFADLNSQPLTMTPVFRLTADALRASSCCPATGNPPTPTRTASIANGVITIGTTPVVIPVAPPPNTEVIPLPLRSIGSLRISLIANEQPMGTGEVNALHLRAEDTSSRQTLDVVFAHASATC